MNSHLSSISRGISILILTLALGVIAPSAMGDSNTHFASTSVPGLSLGNGMRIPQLGLGTWTLGSDTVPSVKSAIRHGYRLFDTAQAYQNEALVWQGIRESGIARSDVFIITKISPDNMRNGTVRESLDESLQKLGGQYIDLVLIHWPVKNKVQQTWQILEEYVDRGVVRAIGLSNFNPHHIEALLKYARIKPVLNQIEIHPYLTQESNVAFNREHNIAVQSWSPLASGTILNDETLIQLAQKHKRSVAQIILRWDIQRGLITIPRSKEEAHIAENIDIFSFSLSDEVNRPGFGGGLL